MELHPRFFAVRPGLDGVSSERAMMAILRLVTQGTRCIVVANIGDVQAFMVSQGASKAGDHTPAGRCNNYISGMTRYLLSEFVTAHPLYHVTQGPRDILYLLSCCVVSEKVGEGTDCIGFKISVIAHESAERMKVWEAYKAECEADASGSRSSTHTLVKEAMRFMQPEVS